MDPKENLEQTIEEITTQEVVAETPKEEVVAATVAEVEQPVNPEPVKDDVVFADKPKKKGNAMVFALVLLALLAAGGIGFGVWAMMDKNQQVEDLNKQITTLKDQNSSLQDKIYELQDEIEAQKQEVIEEVDCVATPEAEACVETDTEVEADATDSTDVVTDDTVTE